MKRETFVVKGREITFVVKGREIVVQTNICMHIKNQIDKMAISHIITSSITKVAAVWHQISELITQTQNQQRDDSNWLRSAMYMRHLCLGSNL
jgi:uncharacterized protein YacL (UPF0231 family)